MTLYIDYADGMYISALDETMKDVLFLDHVDDTTLDKFIKDAKTYASMLYGKIDSIEMSDYIKIINGFRLYNLNVEIVVVRQTTDVYYLTIKIQKQ